MVHLSCKPVETWGGQNWGCRSAVWEDRRESGHDLSIYYPGEVELDLQYPTLVSWVHFKHNILHVQRKSEEVVIENRFFKKIGEKIRKDLLYLKILTLREALKKKDKKS